MKWNETGRHKLQKGKIRSGRRNMLFSDVHQAEKAGEKQPPKKTLKKKEGGGGGLHAHGSRRDQEEGGGAGPSS